MNRLLFALLLATAPCLVRAADPSRGVGFDQHLDQVLPLDASFHDEADKPIKLRDYFGEHPVILVLAYYECPNLCTIVLNGVLQSVRDLEATVGKDFEIVVVSIDPEETPELAAGKKRTYVRQYGRAGTDSGWHFLTGKSEAIRALADAVGFRYRYDEATDQYAHASGILVATPAGRISQYLLGIEYPPEKLNAALKRAQQNQPGTLVHNLLLLCCSYNPSTGKYTLAITRVLQVAGVGTALAIAGIAIGAESRKRRSAS